MITSDDETLIYEIRNLLELPGDPPVDRVAPFAAAYSQRCDEINTRLRECQTLLRQGLRGEALHLAQQEPSVLDQLATLAFDERPKFVELCLQLDIEPPAKLLTEVGAKLIEAGETERVLSVLMRKHRLLALGRAALSKRIVALRQIREADADNPVWMRDLSKYEQARHQQIQVEAEQAYRTGDLGVMIALDRELQDAGWTQKPPTALVDLVRRGMQQMNATRAAQLMRDLAPQLAEAQHNEARDRARELKQQWDSCQRALGRQPIPAEAVQIAAPALAWISAYEADRQREEEYCEAIAALELALHAEDAAQDVGPLWRRIESFGRPVPEQLMEQVQNRRRAQSRRRLRRRAMWGSAAAVVLAVVISLGGMVWRSVHQTQMIAEHVQQLEQLISQQRLEEARAYVMSLGDTDPTSATAQEVRALDARVLGLLDKERQRRSQVSTTLLLIEQAAKFDQPSFNSLDEAESQLKNAKQLELKPSEQPQLQFLAQRIADARQQVQRQIDDAFRADVAAFEQRASALGKAIEQGQDVLGDVQKLMQEMRGLRARTGYVTVGLVGSLDALIQQQEKWARLSDERREQQQAVARISAALPNLTTFHEALASYAQRYSGTPRAVQFTASTKDLPLWQAVERWNQFAERWRQVDLTRLAAGDAGRFLAEGKKLCDEPHIAPLPSAVAFSARLPYLESLAAREANNRAALKKLVSILNEATLNSLRMTVVKQPTGPAKRYYLLEPPVAQNSGEQVTFRAVTSFDLTRVNKVVQREQFLTSGSELDRPAAHNAVVVRVQQMLNQDLDTRGWEATFIDLVAAIQTPPDIEPLVRLLLLQRTLETAMQGSSILAKAWQPVHDTITAADVQLTANWLNPDDPAAVIESQKAAALLARLSTVANSKSHIDAELAKLKQPFLEDYRLVGCLLKDDHPPGNWRCETRISNNFSGELVVLQRDGNQGKVSLERIGKLQAGAAVLDTAKASSLIEGRAVFALVQR